MITSININLTTSNTATLAENLSLNGNLTINSGTFKINNDDTDPLFLDVYGNVLVESSAAISVSTAKAHDDNAIDYSGGYHKYFHVFSIWGNFTNQGSVRFTNKTKPDYDSQTDWGAVSLVFRGESDNKLACKGITDLYYLVVMKGTDQTFSLTIDADEQSYFALYGDNDEDTHDRSGSDVDANAENRKALWIKAGTLILEGKTNIPSLVEEGRDYIIGENASIVLNGPYVVLSATAISSDVSVFSETDFSDFAHGTPEGIDDTESRQSIYVNGSLIINDGVYNSSFSNGIMYRDESPANKLEINGGTVNIAQFRITGQSSSALAKMTYKQTGGTLNILQTANSSAAFDLSAGLGTFTMSGGTINIKDLSDGTTNAIEIACDENNINVTGGSIVINNPNGTDETATISTTAPFYNFTLTENQGNGVQMLSDLTVNNEFEIQAEDFDANDNDIYIGSDLTIASGASYTSGDNTTTFNGTKDSNIYISETLDFYNLTIAKTVDEKDVSIISASSNTIDINGELRVESGGFDYATSNVKVRNDMYISDSIGTSTSSTTGRISMIGSATQNITSVNGVFHNLKINNGNNVSLDGDLNIYGNLNLSNGVFDINTSQLTMSGEYASITGTFGTGEMIQTNGNASDGGLGIYINGDGTYTFPIGTDDNSDTRYTPLIATFSDYTDDGYVYLSVVDNDLPTTDGNGGSMLSYYWHVEHNGFTQVPKVSEYIFSGAESDEDANPAGSFSNSWVAGKVNNDTYTRSYENDNSINEPNDHDINFDGDDTPFDLENADYSAGPSPRFKNEIAIYYTRYTNTSSGTIDYTDLNGWEKGSVGSEVYEAPTVGSIVIIREKAIVNISTASINNPGAIIFDQSLETPNSEALGRLQFTIESPGTGTYNIGVVSGIGMIGFNEDPAVNITADIGDFASSSYSFINYTSLTDVSLSNILEPIPSLRFARSIFTVDQELDINGDLVIQGDGTLVPMQNVSISQNLILGNWWGGNLDFPNTGASNTMTIDGNIDFTYGDNSRARTISAKNATSSNDHTLIVKGDIIQGSNSSTDIDLYNSDANQNVILELQGESDNSYTNSSGIVPEFYRIVSNKGTSQKNSFTFSNDFNLSGETDVTNDKALELQNGTLILDDADITIDLTTGEPFEIPATAALVVNEGTVYANGTDGGINLAGKLSINGGTVDMTGTSDDDEGYIEYGVSGTSEIEITDGELIVGTQIRMQTTTTSGILKYSQTGGEVTIGVNSDDDAYELGHAMLEVGNISGTTANDESNFTYTGGTITIQKQNGASPSIAALYLNPTTYNVSGSTIIFGNDNTPSGQSSMGIQSYIPLDNLTLYTPGLASDPTVTIEVIDLTIDGDLTIEDGVTFDGNGKNLTLKGDFDNDGTYNGNGNTTTFELDDDKILTGSGTNTFSYFTKTGASTLTLEKEISVENDFDLDNGTINTASFDLTVKGNVLLDATFESTAGYGLYLDGTSTQSLARSSVGTSYLDILTISNSGGVEVNNTGHSFYINNSLILQEGVLDIGGSLLELSTTAVIDDDDIAVENNFGLTNMIQTNSSYQDKGVKKNFTAGSVSDFFFPIGQSLYTPATIDLSSDITYSSGSTAGSITIKPASEYHSTIDDGADYYPSSGDINNVLQYYWSLSADNLTGLYGNFIFTYDESDELVDESGKSSADYIAARILSYDNLTEEINKFTTTEVDETANEVTFNFDGDNSNGISGDYFAGIDEAIPNNVATYTTTGGGGDVTNTTTYDGGLPTDGVAPKGAVLIIQTGDEVVFNTDDVKLYKTVINDGSTLIVNNTDGHRLGIVTGTGTLEIECNSSNVIFPTGDYGDFFSCSGGTLKYSGTGSYTVMSSRPQIKNLTLSGSGTKELANDIEVCETLTVEGPTFDIPTATNLTIDGDLNLSAGTFNTGTNNTIDVAGTFTASGGTYNGESSGTYSFNDVTISGATLNLGSGGDVSVSGDLALSSGTFNGGSGTNIIMNGASSQTITGTFTTSSIYNLEIDNASGINLAGDVTIDNLLTLSNGLITPSANTLLIDEDAIISPTSGSSTSYINGILSKEMNTIGDDFIFPVGKSGQYRPASVNDVTFAPLIWEAEYFKESPTNYSGITNTDPTDTDAIKAVSDLEYWVISDNGSSNATIGLSWGSYSKVSSDAGERADLEVMAWNGTTWDEYGGGSFSSDHTASAGSFTSASALRFSTNIITLGSGNENNPLPIELIDFTAIVQTNNIELNWATATETNNDFFSIERSTDGINYEVIETVWGAGNSSTQIDYSETDYNPVYGTSYYRLKQTDYNGQYSYSPIVSVFWNANAELLSGELKIFPNPYKSGDLILSTENIEPGKNINLSIYDFNGKIIYNVHLVNPNNQQVNIIPMAINNLPQGMYILSVVSGSNVSRTKLIIE